LVTTIEAGGEASSAAPETSGDGAWGWYLYGITRRGPLAPVLAELNGQDREDASPTAVPGDAAPLQLLEFSGLAAVVRPVLLADFSLAVLQERLRNASMLEGMVRRHNRVIEAVHSRQAILPAKFGSVYAHAQDLTSALGPTHDTLLEQLVRLEGCDEWAVHLYVEPAVARERIAADTPVIRRLREEHAAARPGRAYFLERQIREELEAASREALVTLAEEAFDRLVGCAVAGHANPIGSAADPAGEVEILRAAFLVAREAAGRFEEEVHASADPEAGVRCEYTGPWPPYSFAAGVQEEAA
jgi:hypothetical protein